MTTQEHDLEVEEVLNSKVDFLDLKIGSIGQKSGSL